jgi:predicted DNA-binding transcriptional regulator AlpA
MSVMRNELQLMLLAAKELPVGELPGLLGELEEIRVTALARLTAPEPAPQQADELLDIGEAARRLGVSKDFLYRNRGDFPFSRRLGRRLLFSALGIDNYIRQQKRSDSKTAKRYHGTVGAPTRG